MKRLISAYPMTERFLAALLLAEAVAWLWR